MRKLLIILYLPCFFSCHQFVKINGRSLNDTLEVLRKKYDFKPLNRAEAYAFINQYYLPRLDATPFGRKIFIHPDYGIDFKQGFSLKKTRLEKLYSGDTVIKSNVTMEPPPPIGPNKTFSWDGRKLLNTMIVTDTSGIARWGGRQPFNNLVIADTVGISFSDYIKMWRRKYGIGFMRISYPQYNAYTRRLVITEYEEIGTIHVDGGYAIYWFEKIPGGWKALNRSEKLAMF